MMTMMMMMLHLSLMPSFNFLKDLATLLMGLTLFSSEFQQRFYIFVCVCVCVCVSIPLHFSLLRSVAASFLMTSLNFSKISPDPCCSRINIQIHPLTLPSSFFQASGARSNNT